MQAAVDGDDLAGGLAEAFRHEEEIRLGLVGRGDRALRQRAVGVELGQLRHEAVGRFVVRVGDVVFRQRANHAVAGEHRGALDNRRGGDAVDADERGQLDGEFAHEVVGGGL